MNNNVVFNISVCIMGILILLVHFINLLVKKKKRKDEKQLLTFIVFTIFHFAVYLTISLIRVNYTNDSLVFASYTSFYIMNNIEVLLLFIYMLNYVVLTKNNKNKLLIIGLTTFAIFIILDIINIFTKMFFYADGGMYIRSKYMIVSQIYQFIIFFLVLFVTLFNKRISIRQKIAFGFYCLIPLVAILLQNKFKGYAIAYASIIISVEILFFFVNVQKNIDLAKEEERIKKHKLK